MADDALARPAAKHARTKAKSSDARCVLFAVITGTNALYDTLGDARALMIINRCLNIMEGQVYEARGSVIKTISNQLMAMFPDANTAGSAAIAMQQSIEHYATEASVKVSLRVGLRSGPVIEEAGDIFGDAVNTAARLVKLAGAGQIITDGGSLAEMRTTLRKKARAIDRRHLKGKSSEFEIVEIGWRRRAGDPFTTEQSTLLERTKTAQLRLRVSGREIVVDNKRPAFTLGRDASNDLAMHSRKASRIHARIEWRRDKFVLFDHSTNGTYVTIKGEPEVMIKHESFLLRGAGYFCLGESAKQSGRGTIEFEFA
jgi:class 3 adenylate cyclase